MIFGALKKIIDVPILKKGALKMIIGVPKKFFGTPIKKIGVPFSGDVVYFSQTADYLFRR